MIPDTLEARRIQMAAVVFKLDMIQTFALASVVLFAGDGIWSGPWAARSLSISQTRSSSRPTSIW